MKKTSPLPPAPPASTAGYGGCHHYLPFPNDAWRGGIYLTSAGHGVIAPGTPYPPVQHPRHYHFNWKEGRVLPEFSFILISAGQGVFESKATGKVTVAGGMCLLLFPGVWHRYSPDAGTGWTEKWFQFTGDFAHHLLARKIISPERAVFGLNQLAAMEKALDDLLARIDADPLANSLPLSLKALSVLTHALGDALPVATNASAEPGPPPHDSVVSAALDFIWSQGRHVLSVDHVVKAVGVNRRTLERRMQAELGRSVLEEIVNVRYHRAALLLRETMLPIKTVATLAGFGSEENMRQTFLKRAKLSPGDYRKEGE